MKTRGFTLLEMLVATTLMAIAVVGLLSALSGSMRNAARLTNHDRASLVARRKMDELLLLPRMQRFTPIEGPMNAAMDAGLDGGWKATKTPFEAPPGAGPGMAILERVELEIWWNDGNSKRTYSLEGYKTTFLQAEDFAGGALR